MSKTRMILITAIHVRAHVGRAVPWFRCTGVTGMHVICQIMENNDTAPTTDEAVCTDDTENDDEFIIADHFLPESGRKIGTPA